MQERKIPRAERDNTTKPKKPSIPIFNKTDKKRPRSPDEFYEQNKKRSKYSTEDIAEVKNNVFDSITNLYDPKEFNDKIDKLIRPSIFDDPKEFDKSRDIFYNFDELILRHHTLNSNKEWLHLISLAIQISNKEANRFFRKSHSAFFKRINKGTSNFPHSNEWRVPEGTFRSLQHGHFRKFFDIKEGYNFFPFNYKEEDDFIKIKELKNYFLLNPPYDVTKEGSISIKEVIRKTYSLARNAILIQILILPKRTESKWFIAIRNHEEISIIELAKPLFYTRGKDHIIHKQAQFQSILVFIGVSFTYTKVINNSIGNFLLKINWFKQFFPSFHPLKFTQNKTGLKTHLNNITNFVEKFENILDRTFPPMQIEKITINLEPITIFSDVILNTCRIWHSICQINPWLKKRFLKFPNNHKALEITRKEAR